MIAYIDSSVALRLVFAEASPLPEWKQIDQGISSAILRVECFRAIDRLRLGHRHSAEQISVHYQSLKEFTELIDFVSVSDAVLQKAAEPLSSPLRTLDAIHLASAILWRDKLDSDLLFATHDRSLGLAASSFGFRVLGI